MILCNTLNIRDLFLVSFVSVPISKASKFILIIKEIHSSSMILFLNNSFKGCKHIFSKEDNICFNLSFILLFTSFGSPSSPSELS